MLIGITLLLVGNVLGCIQENRSESRLAQPLTVLPWHPPEQDLIRLGVALNLSASPVNPALTVLINADEMGSVPHAEYARMILKTYRTSESLSDATTVISRWPEGKHKKDAQRAITIYAKFSSELAAIIEHAMNGDFKAARERRLQFEGQINEAKKPIAQWWENWGLPNWDSAVKELIFIVDAGKNTVHKGQCRIMEKRRIEVGKGSVVKAKQAWAGIEDEPWRTDPRKLQALGKWSEKPKGARGPCPVALSEKLLIAFLPLELGTFFPVNVEHSSEYIPCQHCKPKTR